MGAERWRQVAVMFGGDGWHGSRHGACHRTDGRMDIDMVRCG
jgi:hypothetical protein